MALVMKRVCVLSCNACDKTATTIITFTPKTKVDNITHKFPPKNPNESNLYDTAAQVACR